VTTVLLCLLIVTVAWWAATKVIDAFDDRIDGS
jgi:hypothetical protein